MTARERMAAEEADRVKADWIANTVYLLRKEYEDDVNDGRIAPVRDQAGWDAMEAQWRQAAEEAWNERS